MDSQRKAVLEVLDAKHEYLNSFFKDVMRKSSTEHVWGILRPHTSYIVSSNSVYC